MALLGHSGQLAELIFMRIPGPVLGTRAPWGCGRFQPHLTPTIELDSNIGGKGTPMWRNPKSLMPESCTEWNIITFKVNNQSEGCSSLRRWASESKLVLEVGPLICCITLVLLYAFEFQARCSGQFRARVHGVFRHVGFSLVPVH